MMSRVVGHLHCLFLTVTAISDMATSPTRPRRPTREIPDLPPIDIPGDDTSTDITQVTSSPTTATHPELHGLTPLRAHYLKKSLIQLQFHNELDLATTAVPNNVSTLSYLGPPFRPPPNGSPTLDLPLLRYVFRQFILTFPFMASAPKDFYSEKLQPFTAAVLSRNLSPTSILDDDPEHTEQATRMKLLAKVERNLSLFVGAATKIVEAEQVVRLNQADLERLERLSKKRMARALKQRNAFEVNVVSVRTVVDKGRVRSRVHEEFIIRTRRSHFPDVFVSRRYGDFKTLATELRKHHPNEIISDPPAKDRTTVAAPQGSSPLSPAPSFSSQEEMSMSPQAARFGQSRLAREKNRLTIRAYLHSLLSSQGIANSPVLKSFLLSGPTELTHPEIEDARRREEADRMREDGRKKFAKEIAERVEGLREAVKGVKGDILGKDGLTQVFATVKVTPNVKDLPENYKAVIEWARMSLASTIFQQLVASDNSSETFAGLKRIHGLMPYFMMKTALRITNPVSMIRSMLDLFLAQPFGGRSLLQRMFTSSLTEEAKALEMEIESVKEKVDDPVICEKIRRFVYAPREIQDMFKIDAVSEQQNIITIVLRSGDEPILNRAQLHRAAKASRAHTAYMRQRSALDDSDDDDGPEDEDAWLYEDLRLLTAMYSRLRDREELISLIFEGFTADLLKDIITIFYSPLAQVYRAASIADSLGDMQNFVNDLIKTVESTEELAQRDPHRTVQAFIDLVQRHEQAFYSFVHKVHSKGEGLFDSLMRWIELFLTAMREGLGEPLSLEFLLPHTGTEREEIMKEVDQVAMYHYKLKVLYEDKLRRRFGQASAKGGSADAEDEATQALVDGVVGEISFGDVVQSDAEIVAVQDTDSETSSEEEDDFSDTDSSDEDESCDFDSSEDDSDAEESEKSFKTSLSTPRSEIAPPPPPKNSTPSRSSTMSSATPGPSRSNTINSATSDTSTPTPRARSLSLKHSRSFTALKESKLLGSLSRRSEESSRRPPVPPLPASATFAANKPLPMSPGRPLPPQTAPAPRLPPMVPMTPKKKPKNPKEVIKPPELKHIPKLLPVFIEMMRPGLRPRARTTPPT
ncbi:hypothetical protein DL96DRAFT_1594841 [Flagelloscypha sp. PMI_526]|nr:hypothetical protein DL96DRAFT_1594841 [Flagelloscypha sp. PMI_526]